MRATTPTILAKLPKLAAIGLMHSLVGLSVTA